MREHVHRWPPLRLSVLGPLAAITVVLLAVPSLAHLPAHVIAACARWALVAGVLELLSIAGFVLVFKLVFGARMSWRQSLPAALRGLAASTVLPAGGLIGPAAGARSAQANPVPLRATTRSAIAFVILTSAPGVFILGVLGLLLWVGWAAGPHKAVLTLLPAILAIGVTLAIWLVSHSSTHGPLTHDGSALPRSIMRRRVIGVSAIRGGAAEARCLVASQHWQLVGALGYYAFDNAVLWAAFRAYGPAPPVSIVVMGYLIGSLVGSLPLPAGIGVVEGGMIGALVLYGAAAAPAAAAVLLYRAVSLSLPVILGAPAWRGGGASTPWPRRARTSEP